MTAPRYDEAYYEQARIDEDRVALSWYARVIRRLRRGGRLLEFGCGTGHLLKRLTPQFEAYGYDASPVARLRCRSTAPDAVVLEDWHSLADASLDVIVSLHTLEHVPRPLGLMQQLAAKLAAGGLFFFVVPNPGGIGHRLKGERWFAYRDPTHCSLLSRGEWVTLVRRSGLDVMRVRGDGLWDAPYVRWLPGGLQRALFGAPAALQVFSPLAIPFLPASWGECLIVTAQKPR